VQLLRNIRFQTTAIFLSFLIGCLVLSTSAQGPATGGVDSIRAEELRQKLTYIASEKFKGRGNGTDDLNLAAEYIAGIFEKNGLKPAGDGGSYYQQFNVYSSRLGLGNQLHIRDAAATFDLKVRSDFIPELWSASGTVSGRLELLDDNRPLGPSLNGKIAVELEDRVVSDDPEFPTNATEGRKLQDAGAIGAIIVQSLSDSSRGRLSNLAESFRDDLPVRLTPMAVLDVPDYPQIPMVVLSSDAGRQLLAQLRKPQANVNAVLTVDVERKLHQTRNILGVIEGTDARLRNEVVVVGAHYDHDGEAFGQIWYGADDNGSGTAALLELAEAFGQGPHRSARSVLLGAWAGEEKGLLGSRYYVSHPAFPLDRTITMFQMDMIGRNEDHPGNRSQEVPEERALENTNSLNVLGTAFSPDLKTIIARMNEQVGLTLHFRYDFGAEDLMRRSDQWSFLQKGIPALFFFAGLHPDYHTPRDTADKINYPKLEKAARLVYLSTEQLASAQSKPQFVKATAASQKPY
jgi:Peptidase family M28